MRALAVTRVTALVADVLSLPITSTAGWPLPCRRSPTATLARTPRSIQPRKSVSIQQHEVRSHRYGAARNVLRR